MLPCDLSLSVVIPVYNAAEELKSCLDRLARSARPPDECIVVDDGSTDRSVEVAHEHGATVLTTGGRRGPAYARNLGANAARGDILLFIDSDVCVHSDTVARVVWNFSEDPELATVMGSYDASPQQRDFLSLYKNLMHCFVHQNSCADACTFWSGCGAIRRKVFLEHGGFDESYARPAIEDIELGYRLTAAGKKLMLDRTMLVTHLKKWTFWKLIKTDILDRAIPWTELILRDRRMPNDLNLQMSQRVSVALVFLLFALATMGVIRYGAYFLVPVLTSMLFLLACSWVNAASAKRSRLPRIMMTVATLVFIYLARASHMLPAVPPVLLGYTLLFLRHRYTYTSEKVRRMTGLMYAVYLILAFLFVLAFLPHRILVFAFYFLLLIIAVLNNQFYLFLGTRMGWLTSLAAIPLHLLYNLYNGASFLVGFARYVWKGSFKKKRPPVSSPFAT